MKNCQKIKKDLVAFLYGELDREDGARLQFHLDSCSLCREELRQIADIKRQSDSLSPGIAEAMSSVDWEALPTKIAGLAFEEQKKRRWNKAKSAFALVFQLRWRFVYAGILVGLMIGSLGTYFLLRSPQIQMARSQEIVFGQDFLEKADLEMARRETLDYLEKSQYLLLDFAQSPLNETANFWQDDISLQRARDLLSKKKFINPQLDKFRMAKAKEICDQIELLIYDLIQMSEHLAPEDLERILNLIEEKQLMLKIKLVRKELKKSEV